MQNGPLFIHEVIFALFLQEEHVSAVSFFEVMRLNFSEWPYLLVGTIGAVINGMLQPSSALIFSKIIGVGVFYLYPPFTVFGTECYNCDMCFIFSPVRRLQIQIKPL